MKFIMLIGLPGSGKTTYAHLLLSQDPTLVWLSSDKIRGELYGDENIQGDANKVFRVLHNRVKDALNEGKSVIYDATNVNRKNRRGIINEIKNIDGIEICAHIVWAPYEVCVERDKLRDRTVGEEVIKKFIYRWETPFIDEGFDEISLITGGVDKIEYEKRVMEDIMIPHDNPHHSLGVYDHCMEAKKYAVEHNFPPLIITSAEYHDIGKPLAKFFKEEKDGKIVAHYYNHDNIGGYMALGLPLPIESCVTISWLISSHMQPYFDSTYYKQLSPIMKEFLDMLHEADLNAH